MLVVHHVVRPGDKTGYVRLLAAERDVQILLVAEHLHQSLPAGLGDGPAPAPYQAELARGVACADRPLVKVTVDLNGPADAPRDDERHRRSGLLVPTPVDADTDRQGHLAGRTCRHVIALGQKLQHSPPRRRKRHDPALAGDRPPANRQPVDPGDNVNVPSELVVEVEQDGRLQASFGLGRRNPRADLLNAHRMRLFLEYTPVQAPGHELVVGRFGRMNGRVNLLGHQPSGHRPRGGLLDPAVQARIQVVIARGGKAGVAGQCARYRVGHLAPPALLKQPQIGYVLQAPSQPLEAHRRQDLLPADCVSGIEQPGFGPGGGGERIARPVHNFGQEKPRAPVFHGEPGNRAGVGAACDHAQARRVRRLAG